MKKNTNIKQWLIGALVVQLVLIAIVFNLNDNTQKPENRNLVANFSSVNRIVIADENNQFLTRVKAMNVLRLATKSLINE